MRYVYLQRVVEAITGEPVEVCLERAVFVPLRMVDSSFVWRPGFAGRAVLGHARTGEAMPPVKYAHAVVASTLYTTLADYARFLNGLLLPEARPAFLLEETEQVGVRPDLGLAWGLGVGIDRGRQTSFLHWGANPGFQSFFLCQPDTGRGVLLLTDSDRGLDLVDVVAGASVPGKHPALRFPMLHPKD